MLMPLEIHLFSVDSRGIRMTTREISAVVVQENAEIPDRSGTICGLLPTYNRQLRFLRH
jgi:hypothetical protein